MSKALVLIATFSFVIAAHLTEGVSQGLEHNHVQQTHRAGHGNRRGRHSLLDNESGGLDAGRELKQQHTHDHWKSIGSYAANEHMAMKSKHGLEHSTHYVRPRLGLENKHNRVRKHGDTHSGFEYKSAKTKHSKKQHNRDQKKKTRKGKSVVPEVRAHQRNHRKSKQQKQRKLEQQLHPQHQSQHQRHKRQRHHY